MSELNGTLTISIPSLAFNYVDNKLESIGSGGELYARERGTHVAHYGTRWRELFGTPERAARTFADFCDKCDKGECNDCPLDRLTDFCIGYDDLLEWLRSVMVNGRELNFNDLPPELREEYTVSDSFRQHDRMEGRTLIIDGAEFADTREKLEADIERMVKDHSLYWLHTYIIEWLDRQTAITARECESACEACEDDQDSLVAQMAEEIADLQAQLEEVTRAYKGRGNMIAELNAERDQMQKVITTQAESFRKLEAELSSMVKKYEEQKRRLSDKQQENANQRDELARFNSASKRTKRMPKACVWPRNDDGKLLKPGRDCYCITFFRCGYRVEYANDEDIWNEYRDAREIERAWQRGED